MWLICLLAGVVAFFVGRYNPAPVVIRRIISRTRRDIYRFECKSLIEYIRTKAPDRRDGYIDTVKDILEIAENYEKQNELKSYLLEKSFSTVTDLEFDESLKMPRRLVMEAIEKYEEEKKRNHVNAS